MLRKQVSDPLDSLDSPSWPTRPSKSSELEESLVTGLITSFRALQARGGGVVKFELTDYLPQVSFR
jgi:hypothetical protein